MKITVEFICLLLLLLVLFFYSMLVILLGLLGADTGCGPALNSLLVNHRFGIQTSILALTDTGAR